MAAASPSACQVCALDVAPGVLSIVAKRCGHIFCHQHMPSLADTHCPTCDQLGSELFGAAEANVCVICADTVSDQIAIPDSCLHAFCQQCLQRAADVKRSCPMCRRAFDVYFIYNRNGALVDQHVVRQALSAPEHVEVDLPEFDEEDEDDTVCVHCQQGDRPERLLLCDRCDDAWHTECLNPPLSRVPRGNWYCPRCQPEPRRPASSSTGKRGSALIHEAVRQTREHSRTAASARDGRLQLSQAAQSLTVADMYRSGKLPSDAIGRRTQIASASASALWQYRYSQMLSAFRRNQQQQQATALSAPRLPVQANSQTSSAMATPLSPISSSATAAKTTTVPKAPVSRLPSAARSYEAPLSSSLQPLSNDDILATLASSLAAPSAVSAPPPAPTTSGTRIKIPKRSHADAAPPQ